MLAFADYFLYASEQGITVEECPNRTIFGGYPGYISGFDNSIIGRLGRNKPQGTVYSAEGYDTDKLAADYKRKSLVSLVSYILFVLIVTQLPLLIGILAGIIAKKLRSKNPPETLR